MKRLLVFVASVASALTLAVVPAQAKPVPPTPTMTRNQIGMVQLEQALQQAAAIKASLPTGVVTKRFQALATSGNTWAIHAVAIGTSHGLEGYMNMTWSNRRCSIGSCIGLSTITYANTYCYGYNSWPTYEYLGCNQYPNYGVGYFNWHVYTRWDMCIAYVPMWGACFMWIHPWNDVWVNAWGGVVMRAGV